MIPRTAEPYRVNAYIRGVQEVRLIDDKDDNLGVVPFHEALRMARERELDLVEVAIKARPPVCRIVDYGKFKYEMQKKGREARKVGQAARAAQDLKEVRFSPRIKEHDLQVVANRARKFLEAGHPVRLVVRYRGPDLRHRELGYVVIQQMLAQLGPEVKVDQPPRMEARMLGTLVRQAKPPGSPGASSPEQPPAAAGSGS